MHEAEELCDSLAIIEKGKCVASGDLRTIKALTDRVLDISITFEQIDDRLVQELRQLPLVKFAQKNNTVEMSVKGDGFTSLEMLGRITRTTNVEHIEVSSATLEDVFVSLLGGNKQ